jgi:hypothetical protein
MSCSRFEFKGRRVRVLRIDAGGACWYLLRDLLAALGVDPNKERGLLDRIPRDMKLSTAVPSDPIRPSPFYTGNESEYAPCVSRAGAGELAWLNPGWDTAPLLEALDLVEAGDYPCRDGWDSVAEACREPPEVPAPLAEPAGPAAAGPFERELALLKIRAALAAREINRAEADRELALGGWLTDHRAEDAVIAEELGRLFEQADAMAGGKAAPSPGRTPIEVRLDRNTCPWCGDRKQKETMLCAKCMEEVPKKTMLELRIAWSDIHDERDELVDERYAHFAATVANAASKAAEGRP